MRECLICKNSEFISVLGKLRDRPEINIIECSKCGLVTLESLDHINEQLYQNSKMRPNVANEKWEELIEARRPDNERRYAQFAPLIDQNKVLDFGCGVGGFLLQTVNTAKYACGLELDHYLAKKLNAKNIPVFTSLGQISEKFDLITLFQVLEHLTDPEGVLVSLKDKLTEKGKIIIEVPNSDDALLSLYKSKAFSNFTYWSYHVYLYNANNLQKLAKNLGFTVHYVKQFQRYPLSNHLYWLSNGKPGGHLTWPCLDTEELTKAYATSLAKMGKCDTIIMSIGL